MAYNNNFNNKKFVFGYFIKDEKIICIDQLNNNLGVVNTSYALQLARNEGLELVMVSPGRKGSLSTCKILDFSKFKYEQNKKEKFAKKQQRENAIKIKEVKFRPSIDENDILVKANQLKDFISDGNKVKITILFKGRELCHKNVGAELINKFSTMIGASIDGEISMTGKNMIAFLTKEVFKEAVQ